jgi:dihydrofolate reductase
MTSTTAHFSISLDGFMAGPNQSRDNPLGVDGPRLHKWHFADPLTEADAALVAELLRPRGAFVMGRNMYGPIRGEWDEDWRGWWGEDPPYHAPVFVLTHHPHDPIEMEGGTTFHFVTDGFDAAYAQAREVAGERAVSIAGGASTIRQALTAGVIDEIVVDIAPVILGAGESPFNGVPNLELEPIEAIHSPWATHVRYRVGG